MEYINGDWSEYAYTRSLRYFSWYWKTVCEKIQPIKRVFWSKMRNFYRCNKQLSTLVIETRLEPWIVNCEIDNYSRKLWFVSLQRAHHVYTCTCTCTCVCVRIGDVYRLVLARKNSIALRRKFSRSIRIRRNSRNRRPMDETESIDPKSTQTFKDNGNRIEVEKLKITEK